MNTDNHKDEEVINPSTETISETVENSESGEETTAPETEGKEVLADSPEVAVEKTPEELLIIEKDKYVRLYSDFENFKRRSAKERLEFLQLAGRDVIESVIPVVDDFERALKAAKAMEGDNKALVEGFELIYKKLYSGLESRGLKAMDSVGKIFDAELHEAITKIPAPSEGLKGKVVDEIEKGYTMNDKVIRFAKVIIGE